MKNITHYDSFLNEGTSRTYEEWIDDFINELMGRGFKTDQQIDEFITYWNGKGMLQDYWDQGFSPEGAVDDMVEDGKFKWFK